ncbi:MAG: DUF2911 domain-containing protein [Bacteroidota bacterium]
MRTTIVLVISGAVLLYAGWIAYTIINTKSYSPEETIAFKAGKATFMVTYCRPYKKGRKIFGGLVPYREYWRTGANDATEVSFSEDVVFGGKEVPAGRYRFYTTPDVNEWELVLNSELGQWGAFMPNKDLDVATVSIPTRILPKHVEQFSIFFDSALDNIAYNMHLQWDKTELIVPIALR